MKENKEILVWDSRQQKGKHGHILASLQEEGIQVVTSKLFCGDVAYLNDMSLCIDTKANILELVQNVVSDHERFMNEIKRAEENGIKLVFLVQDEKVSNIDELFSWYNPRTKFSPHCTKGSTIAKALLTIEKYHNTKFYFCKKSETGENILKILRKEI